MSVNNWKITVTTFFFWKKKKTKIYIAIFGHKQSDIVDFTMKLNEHC